MGYFPNGDSGDWYEHFVCGRCIHYDEEKGCPVFMAHVLHNYTDDAAVGEILELLIPTYAAENLLCRMWRAASPEYEDLPRQYEQLIRRREEPK